MKEMNTDKRIITLILKHTMGVITPSELQELDTWRLEDPKNDSAFQWLGNPENLEKDYRLRQSLDTEQSLEEVKGRLDLQEPTKKQPLRSHRLSLYFYRVAAVIALLIVGGAFWYHREYTRVTPPEITEEVQVAMQQSRDTGMEGAEVVSTKSSDNTAKTVVITREEQSLYHVDEHFAERLAEAKRITTYHNKEYWVTLEDGTLVHLNYNSKLIHPEKFGDRRDVILDGEAYFMVAHDKSRQFVVHTPQGDVKVYGTEFWINTRNTDKRYASQESSSATHLSVALVRGSISFTPNESKEYLLTPGQQLSVNSENPLSITLTEVDTDTYVAWNEGIFYFHYEPLRKVAEVLSKWYSVDIEMATPKIGDITVLGRFARYEKLENILDALGKTTGLSVERHGDRVIIGESYK